MKRAAVLLDLGFVLRALYKDLGKQHPTAADVRLFATECLEPDEELFRIYCYHCRPFGGTATHPLTKKQINFSATNTYRLNTKLIEELSVMDNVAFRCGELMFNGWIVPRESAKDMASSGRPIEEADLRADIQQKRVDMNIGLDVAWLSSKAIVDRLILVTNDSDFVPAMKFARREGVQVVIATLGKSAQRELQIHADKIRTVR
ncbi:MAG: NYN domain-containing protein [Phycisphaerales bacterium JB058]